MVCRVFRSYAVFDSSWLLRDWLWYRTSTPYCASFGAMAVFSLVRKTGFCDSSTTVLRISSGASPAQCTVVLVHHTSGSSRKSKNQTNKQKQNETKKQENKLKTNKPKTNKQTKRKKERKTLILLKGFVADQVKGDLLFVWFFLFFVTLTFPT